MRFLRSLRFCMLRPQFTLYSVDISAEIALGLALHRIIRRTAPRFSPQGSGGDSAKQRAARRCVANKRALCSGVITAMQRCCHGYAAALFSHCTGDERGALRKIVRCSAKNEAKQCKNGCESEIADTLKTWEARRQNECGKRHF